MTMPMSLASAGAACAIMLAGLVWAQDKLQPSYVVTCGAYDFKVTAHDLASVDDATSFTARTMAQESFVQSGCALKSLPK